MLDMEKNVITVVVVIDSKSLRVIGDPLLTTQKGHFLEASIKPNI